MKTLMSADNVLSSIFTAMMPFWATADYFYVALHTDDPVKGDQYTNEVGYVGYKRVPVERTSDFWEISNGVAWNKREIKFSECRGGEVLATHISVGVGEIIYCGKLAEPMQINRNCTPVFPVGLIKIVEA